MGLKSLIAEILEYSPGADVELVEKAFKFAERAHKDQKRASGKPYIEHPLGVAFILADLELDCVIITAALLHDVVEDTSLTLEDVKEVFGDEIASLVDGVTHLSKLDFKSIEEYHAESIRKVILATTKDIRIIFVKLADILHNMKTLAPFRPEKQKRIARDALEIYAPIAYKLGIASIKWELEDLSFQHLQPGTYTNLMKKVKKSTKYREKEIAKIKIYLEDELKKHNLEVKVVGRPKHVYSIYKKIERKNCTFEEIYDMAALRIITKNVKQCYEILGIIHNMWKPIPKEFDDYIAMPKSNMYQSLHTVVIGPGGQPIEIQIRTEEMNKTAEDGIAAHWQYKGVGGDKKFDDKISWLKQILEWQKESKDAKEFMEMLHIDFFEDEIFTFTPKGKVIELPKGACILDFAFAVHTQLGEKATGAKVNNKFVPLRNLLKNGDVVEIITSKTQKPSRHWLKIVRTSKAKSKIKQHIRSSQKIPIKSAKEEEPLKKELEEWIIKTEKVKNPQIKIAKCCNPLPGDQLIGLATKTGKVSIHKKNCPVTKQETSLKKNKVKAEWTDTLGSKLEIKVDATNRVGIFAEILNTLVGTQTIIKKANAKSTKGEMVECGFAIETKSIKHLQEIIKRIRKIKDVNKVYIAKLS